MAPSSSTPKHRYDSLAAVCALMCCTVCLLIRLCGTPRPMWKLTSTSPAPACCCHPLQAQDKDGQQVHANAWGVYDNKTGTVGDDVAIHFPCPQSLALLSNWQQNIACSAASRTTLQAVMILQSQQSVIRVLSCCFSVMPVCLQGTARHLNLGLHHQYQPSSTFAMLWLLSFGCIMCPAFVHTGYHNHCSWPLSQARCHSPQSGHIHLC